MHRPSPPRTARSRCPPRLGWGSTSTHTRCNRSRSRSEAVQINSAKQKMTRGEPAFGYSLGLGSPLAAELLARTGIDWVLLETQHGSWGHDGAIAALVAITGGTATPIARVAKNDYFLIGKLLDQGALGIIVPMVDNPEQARMAADACRLPPRGTRSWGVGRARVLGDDYADWIDDQLFVAVQLESA